MLPASRPTATLPSPLNLFFDPDQAQLYRISRLTYHSLGCAAILAEGKTWLNH
jgi:hypothetical protein